MVRPKGMLAKSKATAAEERDWGWDNESPMSSSRIVGNELQNKDVVKVKVKAG